MTPDAPAVQPPNRRTIAAEWASYQAEVLEIQTDPAGRLVRAGGGELAHGFPVPLTEAELRVLLEIRRGFYAGAMALYGIVVFSLGNDATMTAEEAELNLEAIADELLGAGRTHGEAST